MVKACSPGLQFSFTGSARLGLEVGKLGLLHLGQVVGSGAGEVVEDGGLVGDDDDGVLAGVHLREAAVLHSLSGMRISFQCFHSFGATEKNVHALLTNCI